MKTIVLLLLMLCASVVGAHDVYRWVTPDGAVYYSDVPYPGAERIVLPPWPQPGPLPFMAPPITGTAKKLDIVQYKQLVIIKPRPGENVRDNQGNVEIALSIEPELDINTGHKVRILLDGERQGEPSQSLAHTIIANRGRHVIEAQVIDEQGKVLISARPVRFYLKAASSLFHPKHPDVPPSGVMQAPRAPMAPRAPRAPHVPFQPVVTPAPPTVPTPAPPQSRMR